MRIVLIGANGQVGAEVVLLLASLSHVELVPLVRTRGGSAFLRHSGISVIHCSVTDRVRTTIALKGADIVVNFALAGGTPSATNKGNEEIIRATFDCSPSSARLIFFSTLAVYGSYDNLGKAKKNVYGDTKLRGERLVASLAKKLDFEAYILRLGHVAGAYQNITALCRQEIMSPPVVMHDPDRLSNVTHTVTIADAIIAIGEGRAGKPGCYDLVNFPQWTWRQVYAKEADNLSYPLEIEIAQDRTVGKRQRSVLFGRWLFGVIRALNVRAKLMRYAVHLPGYLNDKIRAEYYVDRVRNEIAALHQGSEIRNAAVLWPELKTNTLEGLTDTQTLLDSGVYKESSDPIIRWPPDLMRFP